MRALFCLVRQILSSGISASSAEGPTVPRRRTLVLVYAQSVDEFAQNGAYPHQVSGGRFQFGIGIAHARSRLECHSSDSKIDRPGIGIDPVRPGQLPQAFLVNFPRRAIAEALVLALLGYVGDRRCRPAA